MTCKTIGSLFSGIGGLELGLEWATGARTIWNCEIEPFCRQVLARHWPDATQYEAVEEIDEHIPCPDILCGGFPCTNLSIAGDRKGLAGDKSGLWKEYARIIRVLRPRFVFVENVPAIRNFVLMKGWDGYSETWPRAGTMRNGTASRQQQSAPLTSVTGYSCSHGTETRPNLWPTPTTQDAKNDAGPAQFQRNSKPLNVMAAEYPEGFLLPPEILHGNLGSRSTPLLNPVFVETLMGFPKAWTSIVDID